MLLLLSAPPQGQLGGSTALLQLFGALGRSSPLFRQGSEGSSHQNLHLPRFGSLLKGHPFARTRKAVCPQDQAEEAWGEPCIPEAM